jgi:magnesium transporter
MTRSVYYSHDHLLKTDLSPSEITLALQDQAGVLWVDFQDAPDSDVEPILRDVFHFHPLAIDDALEETHVPKLDDWGTFLYIVLHTIVYEEKARDVRTLELDVFLGTNYVVTHHDHAINAVDKVWSNVQRDGGRLKNGSDNLLYRLVDEIAASYMTVVEQFDLQIDLLEDEIFTERKNDTLAHIFSIKRSVLYLRRILAHQREVLNKLARDQFQVIDASDRIYFRDVYDHMVRLYDITEGVRDMVGGSLDTYLSVINNRMNEIMKTLTIITTLFMPLSFITGFFGMNFFQPAVPLGIWTRFPAFMVTLLIIAATPVVMFAWMRRRRWM